MTKAAKLATQGRLPDDARPPATPTRFDSAMPTLKNRCGNFLANSSVRVELCTSPSTTTPSGYSSPSRASAWPKASRLPLPRAAIPLLPSSSCQSEESRTRFDDLPDARNHRQEPQQDQDHAHEPTDDRAQCDEQAQATGMPEQRDFQGNAEG